MSRILDGYICPAPAPTKAEIYKAITRSMISDIPRFVYSPQGYLQCDYVPGELTNMFYSQDFYRCLGPYPGTWGIKMHICYMD